MSAKPDWMSAVNSLDVATLDAPRPSRNTPTEPKARPVAVPVATTDGIPSERALTGAMLQDAEAVFPLADAAGIVAETFIDADCLRVWRAAALLRHRKTTVELVAISEAMDGDAADNIVTLGELVEACPSSAFVAHYAAQVAEGERRRRLSEAARMAADALAKGGAVDVVAGQLKAAGEAAEGGAGRMPLIVSARDFMAVRVPEPPVVIAGMLRARQVGMMSAGSKAGKSWAMLALSCAVPSGVSWFGKNTTKGRTLYINAELSEYDLQQRLERIARAMGLDGIPDGLDVWHVRGLHTTIGAIVPDIARRQDRIGLPYALIVPDPLYSFHGDRDENSNSEMAVSMGELSELTERTGAACWISHHFSKGSQSGKDHLDRGSGAGVLSRSPDTIMTLTSHEEADCYSVETTCRSFARPDPFVVRWHYPLWEIAADLDPADLKRPRGAGRAAQFDPVQIAELLPPEGLTHGEWKKKAEAELGCKATTFNQLLKKAKAAGLVAAGFGRYQASAAASESGPDEEEI